MRGRGQRMWRSPREKRREEEEEGIVVELLTFVSIKRFHILFLGAAQEDLWNLWSDPFHETRRRRRRRRGGKKKRGKNESPKCGLFDFVIE
jgi:hypothetical protein